MALIDCVDCGHRVSDIAVACPSCGRPGDAGESRKSPANDPLRGDSDVRAASEVPVPVDYKSTEVDPPAADAEVDAPVSGGAGPGLLLGVYSCVALALGLVNWAEHGRFLVSFDSSDSASWLLVASLISSLVIVVGSSAVLFGKLWGVYLLVASTPVLPLLGLAAGVHIAQVLPAFLLRFGLLMALTARRWPILPWGPGSAQNSTGIS
jgi:hypothetical protein